MVKAFGYRSNGTPDVQEFLEIDMPTPLPADLLVQVRAAGVNPVDWKIRSGAYGPTSPRQLADRVRLRGFGRGSRCREGRRGVRRRR